MLSLAQALAQALCHDPRTQQSWAAWQARTAELQLARTDARPTVGASLGAGQARQVLREGADQTTYRAGVGFAALELSWVLLDFGQQHATEQAAQLLALAAAASHDDTVLEVALNTAQAFFALAEADATVQVLEKRARFTDELLVQHDGRRAAGAATGATASGAPTAGALGPAALRLPFSLSAHRSPSRQAALSPVVYARPSPQIAPAEPPDEDLPPEDRMDTELERLQLRADQSYATLERQLAIGSQTAARGELATLLGLPLHQDLTARLDDAQPEAWLPDAGVEALMVLVQRDHPSLQAARARIGAAGADLALARRSNAPRITLQQALRTGRDVYRSSSRDISLGLQLDVPLFAGAQRRHRESLAQAQLDAARAELRSTERQVALQTWSAYQDMQSQALALRQAQTYEHDAKALLAGELASYRADNSDLSDVLDAHSTLSDAILMRLSSLTAWRHARVRLAAVLGRLHLSGTGAARLAP